MTPQQKIHLVNAIDARARKIADELCEETPNIALTSAVAILTLVLARLEPSVAERVLRKLPGDVRPAVADLRNRK
jgi:hypothetical protein